MHTESAAHPHEPEFPPVLDEEGRCWRCRAERIEAERDQAMADNQALRAALREIVRRADEGWDGPGIVELVAPARAALSGSPQPNEVSSQ